MALANQSSLFQELQEKAAMLASALDREGEGKAAMVEELSSVRAELNRVTLEQRQLYSTSTDKEKMLSQRLAEAVRDNAVKDGDLRNTRYGGCEVRRMCVRPSAKWLVFVMMFTNPACMHACA